VKAREKAIPTSARDFERFEGVVTSVIAAILNCTYLSSIDEYDNRMQDRETRRRLTLPSERPPTILEIA